METVNPTPKGALASIVAISVLACAFLFWLLYFREGGAVSRQLLFLPSVNAAFNACASVALILGIFAIKRGERRKHRTFMISAFVFSTLFLLGYITHHALHGDTKFAGEGSIKTLYLSILASHVVLSVGALPMVLTTFYLSLSGRFDRHKRLARYTFPVWLYVSVTGVVVFAMLKFLG